MSIILLLYHHTVNKRYILGKQENLVVRGQCLPIKQELEEENGSGILEKQENLVVRGQCLPKTQESEGKANTVKFEILACLNLAN